MRRTLSFVLAALAATLVGGCEAPATRDVAPPSTVALFDTFGALHRDIGTPVPAAQRYFDQGLRMAYGFNHEAAGRAFAEAARLDPQCAICVWGQALVLGPNINMPMPPDTVAQATALSRRALALAGQATPRDRALIEALQSRYADPAPQDRKPLDAAYAQAMAEVVRRFPEDDDAATLYAEALMDLSPWAYWTAQGQPTEYTPRLLAELERVLARNPGHIGAIHYYIHAVEASPTPQRAEALADQLARLAPGSGHLVHMPAHIYIRTGRYNDATLTNFAATTADAAFLAVCRGSNGMYPLGYVPHNWHFANATAGLQGSRTLALRAAEQTAKRADAGKLDEFSFMQQFVVTPLMTQVRFGMWDAILAQSTPPADRPFPRGIWHFSRGLASLRKGDRTGAHRELAALQTIAADPALQKVVFWDINRADRVLAVGVAMLRGELALAEGHRDAGLAALREAVAAEDALSYTEPPDWPLPMRQYLGAALLDAGMPRDAAATLAQDLEKYPENGWSLRGLALAQRALGDDKAAADTERRFTRAWQWADTELATSRR